MNKNLHKLKYILVDLLTAITVWILFYIYRESFVCKTVLNIFNESVFWIGLVLYPVFWNLLYIIGGMYRRVYRKTRLVELGQTISISLIGVFILFLVLFFEDSMLPEKNPVYLLFIFFSVHFMLTYIGRLLITHRTIKKIHNREIGFNSILIGSNGNAVKLFNDLENQQYSSGNKFVGFVNAKEYDKYKIASVLPHLGSISDLPKLIKKFDVEEVVIAIEKPETDLVTSIMTEIELFDVVIKIIPMFQDYIFGNVKTTGIFETPLIVISPDLMPAWQFSIKRLLDIIFSVFAILLLSPLFIFAAIGVKFSSRGPIIYSQERIGKYGKLFKMMKFRSMYVNAEDSVPMLSSKTDSRITPFGVIMRKFRLDEIPQFFTVLKGDMTIVGPRPERSYFASQISAIAPHFKLIQKVKPGMTSWGQVKFGYAENIDEMIERLQYDILYLENMSLAMDFKIMIWTILIVLQGRGK